MLKASLVALLLPVATGLLLAAPGSKVSKPVNVTAAGDASAGLAATKKGNSSTGWTFRGWYDSYSVGRGIWKWSNAIDAYQPLLGRFIGLPIHMAEVGVQSGGSLNMWHSVIGPQTYVYGLDINPESLKFQDASTSIVIGDQEDPAMWRKFFANTVQSPISILIDDGGHQPNQMLVTVQEVFPQLTADGVIAIEDIHVSDYSATSYANGFFNPVAEFFAQQHQQGKLSSVHLYPFLLVGLREQAPQLPLTGQNANVNSLEEVWEAAPRTPGGHVTYVNPSPMSFLSTNLLMQEVFMHFQALHGGSWTSVPEGCHATAAAVCSLTVVNTPMQSLITGVHIYSDRMVVDVAPAPPVIAAVRHGTEWVTSSVE